MRKPIIAGNWKMNKTPSEARKLVSALVPLVQDAKCDVVVCTPAVDFAAVSEVIKGTNIKLGAENMHWKESGAYTGELSAAMLKESGVEYVILYRQCGIPQDCLLRAGWHIAAGTDNYVLMTCADELSPTQQG